MADFGWMLGSVADLVVVALAPEKREVLNAVFSDQKEGPKLTRTRTVREDVRMRPHGSSGIQSSRSGGPGAIVDAGTGDHGSKRELICFVIHSNPVKLDGQ